MTNKELYKTAREHITYDIPYSTQSLIMELAYKLQAAEEDIQQCCRTCWHGHNGEVDKEICKECHKDWQPSLSLPKNWKWRYYDEF